MIRFRDVSKVYAQGAREVRALANVTHTIERGEFVAVMGPSGSGKSTFLHLAAGLDLPSSGELLLSGQATHAMSDDELTQLRRTRVGLVFQFFNLVPTLSVLENAALPLLVAGRRLPAVRAQTEAILERLGLRERLTHLPDELSGGEVQRVAIARALANDPEVLLADEPTGNLDSATGGEILQLLAAAAQQRTVVMVTHDAAAAGAAARQIHLRDGRLV
ncbi:MAG TPA: ABC transporter ATP-binding protein [Planctomycetota bacterium]|nr:ABC transporter ATP-binding protein [Planctomycetota bacterium]